MSLKTKQHRPDGKPAYEILREIPLEELPYYAGVNTITNQFDYHKFAQELQFTESQLNQIDDIAYNGIRKS